MAFELTVDQPFDLKLTLDCGQGHRWLKDKENPGWYTSVFNLGEEYSLSTGRDKNELVWIHQVNGVDGLVEFHTDGGDIEQVRQKLRWQFRLEADDDDVGEVYAELKKDPATGKEDPHMGQLVDDYPGLRVMRVDPWECLAFFILSTNTDISTTQKRMESIADKLGNAVRSDAADRRTFPTPCEIDNQGVEALSQMNNLNFGLDKDAKIYASAIWISTKKLILDSLRKKPYAKLIQELQQLWGVGPKVSNCTALFSLEQIEAFPVDTHVEEALRCRYGHCGDLPRTADAMVGWGRRRFKKHAGYASQFLFKHGYEYHRKDSSKRCPY